MGTKPVQRGHARASTLGRASAVVLAITLFGAASCSDDSTDSVADDVRSAVTSAVDAADNASANAVEVAARLFASRQASQEFANIGQPIDGDLTCEADATDDLTAVDISCTGKTVDGKDAKMTGTTSEFPGASFNELKGEFVGTVNGTEVFRTDRLGD